MINWLQEVLEDLIFAAKLYYSIVISTYDEEKKNDKFLLKYHYFDDRCHFEFQCRCEKVESSNLLNLMRYKRNQDLTSR